MKYFVQKDKNNTTHPTGFYDIKGNLVLGYRLTIKRICEIMCCTRAYVHQNIQPFVNYVKIPAEYLYRKPNKKLDKEETKDFIRESFLLQEGITYFNNNSAAVWFSEQDFVKQFNSNFKAYRRTQPAEINKLFPKHVSEAKELLNKAKDYFGDLEKYIKDYKETVKKLKYLSKNCNTYKLFKKTWIYNAKSVITDKTSKVPFVPIDRPIKNTAEMDFKVIKDFDYPAAATRHFEAVGAFCYRRPGRSLYKEIPLNELDYLLMSPSYLWEK